MLWNSFEKKVEYMQQEQCNAAYGDITTSVSPVSALWELVDSIYLEVYLEALYLTPPPPPKKKKKTTLFKHDEMPNFDAQYLSTTFVKFS